MPSISKEDYLKSVYKFQNEHGNTVSTADIAADLDVSNAATSDMAKKLAAKGFITYAPYKGLKLTAKGEKVALNILRRHRLWELFLIKVLDLSWSEVHKEAENLEHNTSEFLIDKIDELLEFPEFDPHGSPIPKKNGDLPKSPEMIPLSKAISGKEYRISKVHDKDEDLIKYLTKLSLTLNKKIKVVEKLNFDNSLIIESGGMNITVSEKLSENVFVTKI
ncbi:MAG: metal-dependent transcriptional regulator [Ignavibacteria bacterium]|jgi:DtxR family Mn-dependent transcriptional regulator